MALSLTLSTLLLSSISFHVISFYVIATLQLIYSHSVPLHPIPGDMSACFLDLLLLGFDDILLRVGLAIMDALEEQLLSLDLEELQMTFKKYVIRSSQCMCMHSTYSFHLFKVELCFVELIFTGTFLRRGRRVS